VTAEATDVNKTSNNRAFQLRVVDWMMETFSMEVCRDTTERNHRYLEESLELVQAMGCTQAEAHMLVDYVFGRPAGEPEQEVGGAMVTLAALCAAADFSMRECGERELSRCWQNIERIRAKQAGKPRHSPLPGPTPVATPQPASKDRAPTYRQDLIRRLWGLQCDDLPADAKRAMAEAATELEQVQPPETTGVRPCSCADGARYRFLREPGNAIVYAKDRDAWGQNASGHVRYDTAEQLDAAVDAARFDLKA